MKTWELRNELISKIRAFGNVALVSEDEYYAENGWDANEDFDIDNYPNLPYVSFVKGDRDEYVVSGYVLNISGDFVTLYDADNYEITDAYLDEAMSVEDLENIYDTIKKED